MQCENLGKTEKGGKPSILKNKSYEALKTFPGVRFWKKVRGGVPMSLILFQLYVHLHTGRQ